jgi:enoyl-CoA hydratase
MEANLVTYRIEGAVATITMDDGKSNALSPRMFSQLNAALDRAEAERAVVILTGRQGVFSAGFDLNVLKAGGTNALGMLRAGFELSERVLSFPTPTVVACGGHAIAMGVFLLLCGDYRVGVSGAYKLVANEVAIGLTMPRVGVEICRQRLAPAHFNRAVILAETYSSEVAVEAGFLDRVVPMAELQKSSHAIAMQLAKLDMKAHLHTKLRARSETLRAIRLGTKADLASALFEGARRLVVAKVSPQKRERE